ncbi:MAG: hypothetical protein WKF92_07615 [Pyrinomonadaceae bacterium]
MNQTLNCSIATLALCVFVVVEGYSQKRPTSKAPRKSTAQVSSTAVKPQYDSTPFDLRLEKLPRQYLGHDPEMIFSALLDRKDKVTKGEYETTDAYRQRLLRLESAPLTGQLTTNSLFAFKGDEIETSYDADKGLLSVAGVLENIIEGGTKPLENFEKRGTLFSANRSIILKDKLESRKYPASNSFGVRTIVEELQSDDFLIEINNWSSFKPVKYFPEGAGRDIYNRDLASGNRSLIEASEKLFSRNAFLISVTVDATLARQIRNNLRVLYICRLQEPYVAATSRDTAATVAKLTAYKMRYYYLKVELLEVVVYDVTTGVVYGRITNPVSSSGSETSRGLNVSANEKRQIAELLKGNTTRKIEVESHLEKIRQLIDDFPRMPAESVYPDDPKQLAKRSKALVGESQKIAEGFPKGNFDTYFRSTSVAILEALMMRLEAEGLTVFSEEQRRKSINLFELGNVDAYRRPLVILDRANNLHSFLTKAWKEIKGID